MPSPLAAGSHSFPAEIPCDPIVRSTFLHPNHTTLGSLAHVADNGGTSTFESRRRRVPVRYSCLGARPSCRRGEHSRFPIANDQRHVLSLCNCCPNPRNMFGLITSVMRNLVEQAEAIGQQRADFAELLRLIGRNVLLPRLVTAAGQVATELHLGAHRGGAPPPTCIPRIPHTVGERRPVSPRTDTRYLSRPPRRAERASDATRPVTVSR